MKVLLVFFAVSLVFGESVTSGCPGNLPPVNCFVSPCSLPAPDGCVFEKCKDDFCGGCNRHYFDSNGTEICNECQRADCGVQPLLPTVLCDDGSFGGLTGRCLREKGVCGWEIRECPKTCNNLLTCKLFCPFGYEDDVNDCPICQCKSRPDCSAVACPQIVCDDGSTPSVLDGTCCPVCKPNCALVLCADPQCDANSTIVTPPGECCPTCLPKLDCTTINANPNCKSSTFQCESGSKLVKKACDCFVCERVLDCSAVRCADPQCPPDTKRVVDGSSCCPFCVPLPVCNIACIQLTCEPGFEPVKRDLECCPSCEPVDRCATVRCAEPACPPQLRVKRRGECCETCRQCRDGRTQTYDDKTPRDRCNAVCDDNDDPVCPAGRFRGKGCNETVPEVERESETIEVKLCRTSKDCDVFDPQTIRLLVAKLAQCDSKYLTVEITKSSTDNERCCLEIKIHISKEKSDSSVDVKTTAQQTSSILSQTPDFSVPQPVPKTDSAHISTASALLVVFAAWLAQ